MTTRVVALDGSYLWLSLNRFSPEANGFRICQKTVDITRQVHDEGNKHGRQIHWQLLRDFRRTGLPDFVKAFSTALLVLKATESISCFQEPI